MWSDTPFYKWEWFAVLDSITSDESQVEYILSAADLQLEPEDERVKSKPRPHSGKEVKPKNMEEKIRYIKDILPDKESEFIKVN